MNFKLLISLQLLFFVRELHELHELWPHFAALDGFAVF
jgi:hypothetical protein